jgi:hypothetical protein
VVVTEGIGDTSDLIRSEQVGLVVSPTDAGLAEADLDRLLRFADEVKDHRCDWSRRTMVTARSHLGWTAGAQTLIEQYRKLAATLSPIAQEPQVAVAGT